MRKTCILLFLYILLAFTNFAQGDSVTVRKQYNTQRLSAPIHLNGIPSEPAWDAVPWGGDFIQAEPAAGKPPSQATQFKILYDEKFLYVAYRCHNRQPDSIVKRMARRDEFPGDWVEINIDSYHDLRTAFSFTVSVSGVRGDEFVSNDGNYWDESWNPIWFAKTHIDSLGWTGEVKIPFSQLRYNNDREKVWGFQVSRRLFRNQERSSFQFVPPNSGVYVSRFAELHGLKGIPMHRQVEIAPYITSQADFYKKETGNPFADGRDTRLTAGVDGKLAVTNDLILDFTINPDFGQVEADPSQVRIDGFQNFFEERRPFFIESRNIFNYQLTGSEAGGDYDSDLLFYSRRIGSSPHGNPDLQNGEHVKTPQNTSILGAAKFSGKTRKGWSIGLLESITQREHATIDKAGNRRKELVEPLTNYFVARLQKDIHSGNTIIGGILTGVNREQSLNDQLHRSAYSGGVDFLQYWKARTWYLRGNVVFSQVRGTAATLLNTQTAFEHLFQRPDAPEVTVDSNRTSLSGMGGTIRFGKIGGRAGKQGQVFKFETGVTLRSPGLELNDIGFMLTANEINHFTWAGLHWQRQVGRFRNARLNYNHWSRWDYGGKFLYQGFNVNAHATFLNNWQAGAGAGVNAYKVSNNALRGASALRMPGAFGHFANVTTDARKKLYVNVNTDNSWTFNHTGKEYNITATVYVQPMDALLFSVSGAYSYVWRKQDQFVSNINFANTTRTIVGELDQRTLRFTGRLSYNITPDLTLQYYGQPYITRPIYGNFAYVSDGLAKNFDSRFRRFQEVVQRDGKYFIDENGDGTSDYSFDKPDFNFVQFRSNFVVRWEYKPGSELYFVWSQGNTPDVANDLDSPLPRSLFSNAFHDNARNIFLVKATYRFVR